MHKLRFLLGSVFLLLAATFALAQTGSIQGTVTDSAGAVVQGAVAADGQADGPESEQVG